MQRIPGTTFCVVVVIEVQHGVDLGESPYTHVACPCVDLLWTAESALRFFVAKCLEVRAVGAECLEVRAVGRLEAGDAPPLFALDLFFPLPAFGDILLE